MSRGADPAPTVPVHATRHADPDEPSERSGPMMAPARPLPPASAVLLGAVCAVLGLAPWLLTGMSLPLQNIWSVSTPPEDMPLALLPLSQYTLVESAAMMVVGAALAGAAARVARRLRRPLRPWLVAAGAVAVQAIALVQSAWTLHSGLEDSARAAVYLGGVVAGVVVAIAVGAGVTVAISRAGPPLATLAITVAALALAPWLPLVTHPLGSTPTDDVPAAVTLTVPWLPAVVAGLAIGWCGVASWRRALASGASLATLWVGSAVVRAFSYAVGSRILLQHPEELWPAFTEAFRQALTAFGLPRQVLLATIIAVIIAATWHGLRRIDRGAARS